MPLQPIDLTTPQPNGKMGEPTRSAWEKTNDNNSYLEGIAQAAQAKADAALPSSSPLVTANTDELRVVTSQVPSGQFQGRTPLNLLGYPGANVDAMRFYYYRADASGTGWSNFNWRIIRNVDGTNVSFLEFTQNGNIRIVAGSSAFVFNTSGNATAPGSFVNGGSDPAIKEESSLREISGATSALLGLNVRIGKYKNDYNPDGLERAFVMADDAMRESTPEVIVENVIEGKYAGWATDQLIAYLVAHVQESHELITSLSERISALEAK